MDQTRVHVAGPLASYRDGFGEELSGQGYTPGSASLQLGLMAHVSRWLVSQRLTAGEFTPVRVASSSRRTAQLDIRSGCPSEGCRRCWATWVVSA